MKPRPLLFFSLTVALLTSLPAAVQWDGGGSTNNFNDPANWNDESPIGEETEFDNVGNVSTILDPRNIQIKKLDIKEGSSVNLSTGSFTLVVESDKDSVKISSDSSLDFSGNLSADNKDIDIKNDGIATFSGTIKGAGDEIKIDGNGTTTLSSEVSNFSTFELTTNSELILDGATIKGDAIVDDKAVLRGSGTVEGNLTLAKEVSLSPGLGLGGTGRITIDGDLSFEGGGKNAEWVFDVANSANADRVSVGGNLDISNFTLDLSESLTTSGTVVIAYYGTLTEATGGGFDSVIGLGNRQISYTGNQITITGAAIIPEVTNIVPLSLAFLPLLSMRNRRSRK